MKNWLSNILLFSLLLLFTPLVVSGAENDIHSKEASYSITQDSNHTFSENSNKLIQYNLFLSKFTDCILEKELLERIRFTRLTFYEPSITLYKKLICEKRAQLSWVKINKSYTSNHDSYVEMLFSRKLYIYGRNQLLI